MYISMDVCLFCFGFLISLIVSGSCYLEFCFTGNSKVMELAKIDLFSNFLFLNWLILLVMGDFFFVWGSFSFLNEPV